MKKWTVAIAMLLGIIMLSIFAASQLGPLVTTEKSHTFISAKNDLVQSQTCTTSFFDEVIPTYQQCTYYSNYTSCLNSTGPNTDCSARQSISTFQCQIGASTVTKNTTSCTPDKEFIIETIDGGTTLKKKIDYSDWGPCVHEIAGSCLIITCVSYNDGAHNGQFTDCNGGKSCQRFEICDDYTKTTYKNSREDFVEDDPSFYYKRLAVQEVG